MGWSGLECIGVHWSGLEWLGVGVGVDWLKQQGLSDNQIRGLVLISQDLLDTSILQRIQSVQAEIYRIQNGDK